MPFLRKKTDQRIARGPNLDSAIAGSLAWAGEGYKLPVSFGLDSEALGLVPGLGGQRLVCGNAECTSTWMMPWRNRRRPVFEGQWGCSGRCVLEIVRAAITRELGFGETREATAPHRHRVPLGLLMLAQGWITHSQLRKALEAQRVNGTGRIGDWLISECGLEREQITRGLSMQWSCPVLPVTGFVAGTMVLVMPKLFVEEFGLLPLRVVGPRTLYLGFEDHLDASAALAVEQMTELKVESGLVDGVQFRTARSRLLEFRGVDAREEPMQDTASLAGRVTAILEQRQPVASRLVRLHQYFWLRLWLESGAKGKNGTLPQTREDVLDYVFTIGGRG